MTVAAGREEGVTLVGGGVVVLVDSAEGGFVGRVDGGVACLEADTERRGVEEPASVGVSPIVVSSEGIVWLGLAEIVIALIVWVSM